MLRNAVTPRGPLATATLAVLVALAGCSKHNAQSNVTSNVQSSAAANAKVPDVVTPQIQAGIEKHIEEETRKGNGYFKFTSGKKNYSFKLVRIHTEYLASLGPKLHFACVDMVDTKGDVYDLDFFLAGSPGSMTVTETTLHKLNGIPFYTWEEENGVWRHVPIKGAPPKLLGVLKGRDTFEFYYHATLPEIKKPARLWLPYATSGRFQNVTAKKVAIPGKYRITEDREYGNKILFAELGPEASGKSIDIQYHVERKEKAAYEPDTVDAEKYLAPDRLAPASENFKKIAERVTADKKTDLVKARALYDHVIERMKYAKHGKGWGKGDAQFACDSGIGNCTDYHAYFMALARAIKIPARFAIGAAVPSARDTGGLSGYHCWVEFYADKKWWPVDISEADKYSSLSTYYFGHNPANRVAFSRGRDLVVDPAPASGPINFLAYPLLEIAGVPTKVPVKFSFKRTK